MDDLDYLRYCNENVDKFRGSQKYKEEILEELTKAVYNFGEKADYLTSDTSYEYSLSLNFSVDDYGRTLYISAGELNVENPNYKEDRDLYCELIELKDLDINIIEKFLKEACDYIRNLQEN